jgi:uncharacterized protein YjbJ (UPF0337 family)
MGLDDKMKNKAEETVGKAKEYVGERTDNERLVAEGQSQRTEAELKQAGERVKDAARDAKHAVSD